MSEQAQAQTTPEQRAELARLAEAADKQEPGPWSVGSLSDEDDPEVNPDDICDYEVLSEYTAQGGRIAISSVAQGMHKPEAEFIAAANPVAVKALLAALAAAEQRAAVAEKALEITAKLNDERAFHGCDECPCADLEADEEDPDECSCGSSTLKYAMREARAALGLAAPAEQ